MRTSHRWKSRPGNFDALNWSTLYDSDEIYGIPLIQKETFVPDWLLPIKQRVRVEDADMSKGAVQFFVDDYHFESVWGSPKKSMLLVGKTGNALSPDFSLFVGDPLAIQIWNTYRNRWLGRYWQERGIKVIPSITWSDEESYDFCFAGVEKGSTVAISTVGANKKDTRQGFIDGFEIMLEAIEPELVLVYGEAAPIELEQYVETKWYPSYWKTLRDIMAQKAKPEGE